MLLAFSVCSLFVYLGSWQLERGQEKRHILQEYEKRRGYSLRPLYEYAPDYSAARYVPVFLQGRFVAQQFLLDNQIYQRQVGVNVLTPFVTQDGRWILVDRGWVLSDPTRRTLPDVAVAEDQRQIHGTVYVPFQQPFALGQSLPENDVASWPVLAQYLDFDAMSRVLGETLETVVVRLSPEEEDGYAREWPVVSVNPERHLAYAVQWFGMAMAIVGIVLTLGIKKKTGGVQ